MINFNEFYGICFGLAMGATTTILLLFFSKIFWNKIAYYKKDKYNAYLGIYILNFIMPLILFRYIMEFINIFNNKNFNEAIFTWLPIAITGNIIFSYRINRARSKMAKEK